MIFHSDRTEELINGVDDEVTVFMRHRGVRLSNDVVVTILSTNSKDEIKNRLKKRTLFSQNKAIERIVMRNQRFHDGNGSVEIIKPFIFDCGYTEVEGYPLKWGTHARAFYLFLVGCRFSWKKTKVDKILKEFVLLENSNMSRVEKAEVKFKLMGDLNKI